MKVIVKQGAYARAVTFHDLRHFIQWFLDTRISGVTVSPDGYPVVSLGSILELGRPCKVRYLVKHYGYQEPGCCG